MFNNWQGQREYNAKANLDEKVYTKWQMWKLFHLVPKNDVEPIRKKMSYTIIKNGEKLDINREYNFYTFDMCEEYIPKERDWKARDWKASRSFEKRDDRYNDFEFDDCEIDFNGAKICVTGTLVKYTRTEVKEKLESLGAIVTSGVSKKTDYLLAGINAGSKLEKAKSFKIPIISEEDLETYDKNIC